MKKINNKFLTILSILFIIIGISIITINLINSKEDIIYDYNILKNSNSEVYLLENNFYDNKILNKDDNYDYYASKSIDKIKINFDYKFNSNKKNNIKYKYNIKSQIVSNIDNEDNLIWNKTFTLKDNTEYNIKSNNFDITDEIYIDYNYYNSYVDEFEKTYNIKTNSILKIYLNVSFINEYIDKTYNDYIEIDIPLSNKLTSITNNYEKSIVNNITNSKDKNYIIYIIGSSFIILSAIFINIVIFNKNKLNKNNKILKLKLKEYNEIIINVTSKPNTDKLNYIFVKSIDDLINIAVVNNTNIICYESTKKKNFYVIINDYVYIFSILI